MNLSLLFAYCLWSHSTWELVSHNEVRFIWNTYCIGYFLCSCDDKNPWQEQLKRGEFIWEHTVLGDIAHYNLEGTTAEMALQWQELEAWFISHLSRPRNRKCRVKLEVDTVFKSHFPETHFYWLDHSLQSSATFWDRTASCRPSVGIHQFMEHLT